MSILILGKNGFLGKRIEEECIELGLDYFCLSRKLWAEIHNNLQTYIHNKNIKSIIFCAGYSKRFDSEEIDKIDEIDILSRCLNLQDCRVIYLSSSLVYGQQNSANSSKLKESLVCRPTGAYGMYKRILEKFVLSSQKDNIIIRLTSCIGKEKKTGLMQTIEKKIHQSEIIKMDYGDTIRDYIHVKLAAKAIVEISLSEKSHGIYNVGSGKGLSVREIIKKTSDHKKIKIKDIIFGENMKEDPNKHIVNLDKTKELISNDLFFKLTNIDQVKEYLEENRNF